MLQYNLTRTEFFEATAEAQLPNDAEMFAITVALLLVHEAAFTELAKHDLELTDADIECVAECIKYPPQASGGPPAGLPAAHPVARRLARSARLPGGERRPTGSRAAGGRGVPLLQTVPTG